MLLPLSEGKQEEIIMDVAQQPHDEQESVRAPSASAAQEGVANV
jgi:hypothetical protein